MNRELKLSLVVILFLFLVTNSVCLARFGVTQKEFNQLCKKGSYKQIKETIETE